MKADRNIAAFMALIALAMFVGLVAPAAADGIGLGDGDVAIIDESNTPASGTSVQIANTMSFAQSQHFEVLADETILRGTLQVPIYLDESLTEVTRDAMTGDPLGEDPLCAYEPGAATPAS